MKRRIFAVIVLLGVVVGLGAYFVGGTRSGSVVDEARLADRGSASLAAADEDYFHAMDGGPQLSPDEVRGRNMWLVWTGGNDRFWDEFSDVTFGNFDLLKILSSYPGLGFDRSVRWDYFGLINEPCFTKAVGPNGAKYGLWLDTRDPACPPDPFASEAKYPGIKIGARGSTVPVGSYYGEPSGILGLRLFPNPAFDEAARQDWDPVRYYTDPSYYNRKDLVRPYRVGMSCGFCHIGPSPTNPPADAENPKWENLSGTVGAQYFWVDRIFSWPAEQESFIYQLLQTARPGALDSSLISSDYINNPRTMNSVYELGARMELALKLGHEDLAGDNLVSKQFNDHVKDGPLTRFFEPPSTSRTPHILKDASDSIGPLAALNRVYLNIGLFSEEWLLHFNPVIGGKMVSPMRVKTAQQNSPYWQSTEQQTLAMAQYLVKVSAPHRLADAPRGAEYLSTDQALLDHGRDVFGERCARCHSSKFPEPPAEANPAICKDDYLSCWDRYWTWTKTDEFKRQMRDVVRSPDFLTGNFLSTDMRVPSSLLQTNLCSPLATNAIAGNIWDDFSSKTYKDLGSIGEIDVLDPVTGQPRRFDMPGGGRGYTRPPSLVSLWSSAPFLLDNSLGRFDPSPSVEARIGSFDDAIRKLLWPETRERDPLLGEAAGGMIDRVREPAYLTIPPGYLPSAVRPLMTALAWGLPSVFVDQTHHHDFAGTTSAGSDAITGISTQDAPLRIFVSGATVAGPGLEDGTRVVVYDGAAGALKIDRPAVSSQANVAFSTETPEAGVKVGPIPEGTPINLVASLELAPERGSFLDGLKHQMKVAGVAWNFLGDIRRVENAESDADRHSASLALQQNLQGMSKCPDVVISRGHYFGTDRFAEEPGLSNPDKEALIAFLKTL